MSYVLQSMDDVAALMRESLPNGMTPSEFGRLMNWGRGSEAARVRLKSITKDEIEEIGLDEEQTTNWAVAYEAVARLMPDNPSAVGRAELMRHAAELLRGE